MAHAASAQKPAAQRIGRSGRESFVHANVVEARPARLEPFVIFLNQLPRRIRDFFIIVPPLAHETVRIVIDLGGVGNVVPCECGSTLLKWNNSVARVNQLPIPFGSTASE
jgi:hypothetical protein